MRKIKLILWLSIIVSLMHLSQLIVLIKFADEIEDVRKRLYREPTTFNHYFNYRNTENEEDFVTISSRLHFIESRIKVIEQEIDAMDIKMREGTRRKLRELHYDINRLGRFWDSSEISELNDRLVKAYSKSIRYDDILIDVERLRGNESALGPDALMVLKPSVKTTAVLAILGWILFAINAFKLIKKEPV